MPKILLQDYAFTDWGKGIQGVKALAASVRVGLPDYREEIKPLIDGGEYIIVELLIEGRHTGPNEWHGTHRQSGCLTRCHHTAPARR
jgi:hypothetical protein